MTLRKPCPGYCCSSLTLYHSPADIAAALKLGDVEDIETLADMLEPVRRVPAGTRPPGRVMVSRRDQWLYRCRRWDPQTGRCTRYDERPGLCRRYPKTGKCGYRLGKFTPSGCYKKK